MPFELLTMTPCKINGVNSRMEKHGKDDLVLDQQRQFAQQLFGQAHVALHAELQRDGAALLRVDADLVHVAGAQHQVGLAAQAVVHGQCVADQLHVVADGVAQAREAQVRQVRYRVDAVQFFLVVVAAFLGAVVQRLQQARLQVLQDGVRRVDADRDVDGRHEVAITLEPPEPAEEAQPQNPMPFDADNAAPIDPFARAPLTPEQALADAVAQEG